LWLLARVVVALHTHIRLMVHGAAAVAQADIALVL
jgi:hypothetical protein